MMSGSVLCVGIGGAGSRLAPKAADILGADCLVISQDARDAGSSDHILIPTESIINPSPQLLRGFTAKASEQIRTRISDYTSIVMIANLAGRGGAGIAPIVSRICKDMGRETVSFAIMPFGYEKNRIFSAGVALKRLREDSACCLVLDNNAMLASNPELSANQCYDIANSAILYAAGAIRDGGVSDGIITTSTGRKDLEESLRDSFKMLYENVPPSGAKQTVLYVLGGADAPVGLMDSIAQITGSMSGGEVQVRSDSSDESKVVMVTSVEGHTVFEKYDPLGIIPKQNMLDWDEPDCIMDCKLDFYQLE